MELDAIFLKRHFDVLDKKLVNKDLAKILSIFPFIF